MIDYDFSTLNDKEFENLSIDLISKDKSKRFERFKVGKDGGIDGRYYRDDGKEEIIQCKHYLKTGFDGLITSLKKKSDKGINEIEKIKKLNPIKYIFVTSIALSAENKKSIKALFDPYIKNYNDIYGQEDLNVILGNNSDIEKRYYKLWLSSTVVLDRLLNNAIESRSEFLLEDIKEKSKYYVVTDNHNKAIEKLDESHIIIIAGEPGIGKTTLAEHMALWYTEKDFKLCNIENSINEAESIYKKDEKQIFYFDDFLGANYLNAIEDKKDSHIVKFMNRIKKDKTKRFILTSRTNIFNQGLAYSDTFKSNNLENEEFIIKIESLKDIDKAMILYNHIWHSDLEEEFLDQIYIDKRYKHIINHKNFNPRLIAFITDIKKIKKEEITAENYWNYIVEKLDNPQDVWKKAFEKDSDEFARIIVLLTVFNDNKIEEEKLRNAYTKYIKFIKLQNYSHTSKEFDHIVEEVVKYFLNRSLKYNKTIEYSLFNPSIADYVLNQNKNETEKIKLIYSSLQTVPSLFHLKHLTKNDFINNHKYKEILTYLFEKYNFDDRNYIFFIKVSLAMINENMIDNKLDFDKKIKSFIDTMTPFHNNNSIFTDFLELLVYATKEYNYQINLKELVTNNMVDDLDDIPNIIKIYNNLQLQDISIITDLEDSLEDTLIDKLHDLAFSEIDIAEFMTKYSYDNFDVDESAVEDAVSDLLDDLISDFDTNVIKINTNRIIENIDIDDLISSYFSNQDDDYYEGKYRERQSVSNNIDDLFER